MAVQLPKATRESSKEVDSRLEAVIAEQEKLFVERQPRSLELSRRAVKALAGGVTSSWQITRPQSVWISHGKGSKIYDVDGEEYVDMHGGYGAGLAGHAHPAIPIRPKVNRIDAAGLVFSGSVARRMMNRKIHGSERQRVVNPETA